MRTCGILALKADDTAAALRLQPQVLLVELDPEVQHSRELLLRALQHPLIAVRSYLDVCGLPPAATFCLVVINLSPSEQEAVKIAAHVRRTWKNAFILLLGTPSGEFDDPLYDEAVNPHFNPAGVMMAAARLLSSRANSLEILDEPHP